MTPNIIVKKINAYLNEETYFVFCLSLLIFLSLFIGSAYISSGKWPRDKYSVYKPLIVELRTVNARAVSAYLGASSKPGDISSLTNEIKKEDLAIKSLMKRNANLSYNSEEEMSNFYSGRMLKTHYEDELLYVDFSKHTFDKGMYKVPTSENFCDYANNNYHHVGEFNILTTCEKGFATIDVITLSKQRLYFSESNNL